MSTIPSLDQQIDEVKRYIADLARRMATLDEKRRAAWLNAIRAYREKLAELTQTISFVVRDVLYSKIVAASAPWAPVPQVTAPQLGLRYPLRTQHPVLGEIPFVQSMVTELTSFDIRYLDIVDAIVEGNWRLLYAGEEYRPVTTAHFQTCQDYSEQAFYTCIAEALDGVHKCVKYHAWYECAVHASNVSIPDENCTVTLLIFEGREEIVGCLTDKCCSRETVTYNELSTEDYDWASDYPAVRIVALNSCSRDALLVTPYGNVPLPPATEVDLVVAQFRGMRETCTLVRA